MRRFLLSAITVAGVAACSGDPTTVQQRGSNEQPSHTLSDSTAVTAAEDRNGNTMGSGH